MQQIDTPPRQSRGRPCSFAGEFRRGKCDEQFHLDSSRPHASESFSRFFRGVGNAVGPPELLSVARAQARPWRREIVNARAANPAPNNNSVLGSGVGTAVTMAVPISKLSPVTQAQKTPRSVSYVPGVIAMGGIK